MKTHEYKGHRYRVTERRLEIQYGDLWRRVTRAEWDAIPLNSSLDRFRLREAALTPPNTASREASRRASVPVQIRVTQSEHEELVERAAEAKAPSLTAWVRTELGLPETPPRQAQKGSR